MKDLNLVGEQARELLLETTSGNNPCAVLLSNGVDSNSVLASLLSNGRKPFVFSIRVKGTTSTDWLSAKRNADKLDLRFIDVELPKDLDAIFSDVKYAITQIGLTKKADIECFIPIKYALDKASLMGIKDVYSGHCADGHYGLGRKPSIEIRNTDKEKDPQWLENYRLKYFGKPNPAQSKTLIKYFQFKHGTFHVPYLDSRFFSIFEGISHYEMNKPKEKMPIRLAFPEFDDWNVGKKESNLQLGDSGIADNYARLLQSEYNLHGNKAVIGIYNAIARGEL